MKDNAVKERPIIFSGEMVCATLDGRKTQTRRVIKPQPVFLGLKSLERGHWAYNVSCGGWEHVVPAPDGTYRANSNLLHCPYGQPGDRLWVRETWCHKWDKDGPVYNEDGDYDTSCLWYRATTPDVVKMDEDFAEEYRKDGTPASPWIASIHMPLWASRIDLEVPAVRVERVQDISEEDVLAEGVDLASWVNDGRTGEPLGPQTARFAQLWNSINAKPKPAAYVDGRPTIYFSAPWDEADRDPRKVIAGLPHVCYPNPWVWVIEFRIAPPR